jgi:2-polyprenyl-3-methyl-5-hydroxy-6-metoxy-1,4-benzoquinol methylase
MKSKSRRSWPRYMAVTKKRKPNPLIAQGAKLLGRKGGQAIDVGCGAGVDAREMARLGFEVLAIDKNPSALRTAKILCRGRPVRVERIDIAAFRPKRASADLVLAWNSLPFLAKKKQMLAALRHIVAALKPGGIFIFSLFGPDDEWARRRKSMSFLSAVELKRALRGAEFIELHETWRREPTALGVMKDWHELKGFVRKPAS